MRLINNMNEQHMKKSFPSLAMKSKQHHFYRKGNYIKQRRRSYFYFPEEGPKLKLANDAKRYQQYVPSKQSVRSIIMDSIKLCWPTNLKSLDHSNHNLSTVSCYAEKKISQPRGRMPVKFQVGRVSRLIPADDHVARTGFFFRFK